jgi:O-succinylbenzoate synthase
MRLIYPFRTAFSDEHAIESILVRVTTREGFGWGEAAPWRTPAFSAEWAAGAFQVLRDFLVPPLLGRTITEGDELAALVNHVKGNYFAKAAIDLALWDLRAKVKGQPLWQMLGGSRRIVDVGADFGVMENFDALLATIDEAARAGFKRVKLKYRPGWELEMIAAVRGAFPRLTLHVDCNSAYTIEDAPMLKKLDRYDLAMIEQPLAHDDLVDHAKLQRLIDTPICLDESITSPAKARQAADIGACRWVNIKPGRVGGLTNAIKIHDVCRDAGIKCWVGGMLESSVGAHHCLALATLPNILYPSDLFPTSRFYARDLARPDMALSGPSEMMAPAIPGVGAEPDEQALSEHSIETCTLRTGRNA